MNWKHKLTMIYLYMIFIILSTVSAIEVLVVSIFVVFIFLYNSRRSRLVLNSFPSLKLFCTSVAILFLRVSSEQIRLIFITSNSKSLKAVI